MTASQASIMKNHLLDNYKSQDIAAKSKISINHFNRYTYNIKPEINKI